MAFGNGANDNFKGFATIWGTASLSYREALRLAALATVAGSFLSLVLAQGLVQQFSGNGLLLHLVTHPHAERGLIASLVNPRIAAVLVGIHECPQAHLDLAAMATLVGMSRTAFATRFKEIMVTSPGKYLVQMRLQIAQCAVDRGKGLKGAAQGWIR